MTALRILSYQPNPRVWKATIAARLGAVELELRGAAPEAQTTQAAHCGVILFVHSCVILNKQRMG